MNDEDDLDLDRLTCTASVACEKRVVELAAEATLRYEPSEWRDTIVFLLSGEVEIECADGQRRCFERGATLVFPPLPIRMIRNPTTRPTRLLAISRRVR